MKKPRFKTALACDIARVDRGMLNEAIAGGYYGCAPSTTKGATRVFDVDQTITLFIFGHLTKFGISARQAGEYACHLYRDIERLNGKEGFVSILFDVHGFRTTHIFENGRQIPIGVSGRGPTATALAFDVGAIRKHILDRAEEEFNSPILGEDD